MKTIKMYQIELDGKLIGRRFNTQQGAKCVLTRLIKDSPDVKSHAKIVSVEYIRHV